ncbi:MAG: NAD(P)H-hydrate dehydratase, partial [Polaromonas sp.]
ISQKNAAHLIATHNHPALDNGIFTLSLLTLKPGLFTASGRDSAGHVWFDDLDVTPEANTAVPCAWLGGADHAVRPQRAHAAHASHKGSFGDVALLGGESGTATHMTGAALLAARAALHAGAGRVFVALLGQASLTVDPEQPELMFRSPEALDLKHQVVVCGCGGGDAIRTVIAKVLSAATRAVLDADALNAIASDQQLQTLLAARHQRAYCTVLTPHPLEAARLLGRNAAEIQADRLAAARQLAEQFQCVIVLKGSGTVIAAPGQLPVINSTGNALLAGAGTGDVLAGMMGAYIAGGLSAFEAACGAVFTHGDMADQWAIRHPDRTLTASVLARLQQG